MPKHFPTLSSAGWVTSPITKIDRALAYAFVTDAKQSNVYRGILTSIPAIIQKHLNDPVSLASSMGSALETYFGRIFDRAVVVVTVTPIPNKPLELKLTIRGTVVDDDVPYDLAREAYIANGKFMRIAEANNG